MRVAATREVRNAERLCDEIEGQAQPVLQLDWAEAWTTLETRGR
jgi:hypothetical protein